MNMPSDSQNPYAAPTTIRKAPIPTSEIEEIRNEHLTHEASIRSFGVLYLIAASFLSIIGIFLISTTILDLGGQPGEFGSYAGFIGAGYFGLGIFLFWVAIGLRNLSSPARVGATVYAVFGLIGFPIGTLISGYLLYLLWSEKGLFIFTPEYRQIREQTPHIKYKTSIIVWILVGLLLLLVVIGLMSLLLTR